MYYATYPQVLIFDAANGVCSPSAPDPTVNATPPSLDGITVDPVDNAPGLDLRVVQLSIWGRDPYNVTLLPWNASGSAVAAAVEFATGFRPSVTQRR
jgi:hypothetical protein